MKKSLFVGIALALTALLMFSCNKNRFDFDELHSAEGSGQWKLPIGSLELTLGDVMTQLGNNDLISYDPDGNLQIRYQFKVEKLLKGSTFLNLGSISFSTENTFPNPFPGVPLTPIDTVFRFNQKMEISTDSAGIETAIIKSGELLLDLETNLGNISEIVFSSSNIIESNGDSLVRYFNEVNGNRVDLSGATFHLHDPVTGVADSTLTLNYAIHYQLTGIESPEYQVNTNIGLEKLKFQEISGYVDNFSYSFEFDTTFSLPLGKIQGQVSLVGADIKINERNTFEGLHAKLQIDQAEFYGNGIAPSPIFKIYPYVLEVIPSNEFVNVLPDETLDLTVDTRFNGVRVAAVLDFNPGHVESLVAINDTSTLDLQVDATIPMQFNIPGVYYTDTLALNLSDITAPDLVKEVLLTILFNSEIPFNLTGQLYTFNSLTGQVTDSLLTEAMYFDGSFDGTYVRSDAEISLTHERLEHLLAADKLIIRFGVDTEDHNVMLNLDNGIGLTLKADVLYGGSVEFNQ